MVVYRDREETEPRAELTVPSLKEDRQQDSRGRSLTHPPPPPYPDRLGETLYPLSELCQCALGQGSGGGYDPHGQEQLTAGTGRGQTKGLLSQITPKGNSSGNSWSNSSADEGEVSSGRNVRALLRAALGTLNTPGQIIQYVSLRHQKSLQRQGPCFQCGQYVEIKPGRVSQRTPLVACVT